MFGFSFGELVVLVVVAVVVIGPKDMPKVLRRLGQWASKLRRMASEIRVQSGIDDVLRGEGIAQDIAEIRKLARGEMDNVVRAARLDAVPAIAGAAVRPPSPHRPDPYADPVDRAPDGGLTVLREREYPREGADSYKAISDTALVFNGTLPASPLAADALYRTGDPNGVVPLALSAAGAATATSAPGADASDAAGPVAPVQAPHDP